MQARSLLFTIYGDFILRYGQEVSIRALIRALAEFGLKAPAVRMAVSRVNQEGLLRPVPQGRRGYYELTDKGRRRVETGLRRLHQTGPEPWDGQWRFVVLLTPEDRRPVRDQVRAELTWHGFGQLTPSTWISPNRQEEAIISLVADYDLNGYLHQFSGRYGGPSADRELVVRCWDLPAIGARYEDFIGTVQPQLEMMQGLAAKGDPPPDHRCFTERVWLVHEWRKFLHFDPDLPLDLLPAEWPATRAHDLFWAYYRLLSGGAERFFLEVFYPRKE